MRDDGNCCRHGIGNKTFLVGFFVQPVDIALGWLLWAAKGYFRMEINTGYSQLAVGIFFQVANRRVVVGVNDKTAA
jgi:hypothetical protein